MKKTKFIFCAIVLSVFATASRAEVNEGNWYVAPIFSFTINSPHRTDRVGWASGLTFGRVLSDSWNVELGGQYSSFGAKDNQASIGVDALYFFSRDRHFSPYATLGTGYAYEGDLPAGRDKYQDLMLRGGFGFTTNITKNIDLRMDARYQWHGAKSPASSLGDWFLSAGVNFYF